MSRQAPMLMGGGGQGSFLGRLVSVLFVIGIVAWIVKDPAGAATVARHLGAFLGMAIDRISTFVSHLSA